MGIMVAEWFRRRGRVILLVLCIVAIFAAPAGARGPTIRDIQPYDTIFVYEEGLNLSALRNATTNNPITALHKYQNDRPYEGITKTIPVADDTNFDLLDFFVGDDYGTYYAFNPIDGATAYVFVREPEVFLDVVLAHPYHNEPLEGLTVSPNTRIAFRISAPEVGASYRVGSLYPATIDLVLTTPSGAETTVIGGINFAGLNVSSPRFYTDDPGRPGAVRLGEIGEPGIYSVRAVWRTPESFDAYAPDSEPVTFTVANRIGIETTATPTPTATATVRPTVTRTTPAPTTPAPAETTPPTEETPAATATETTEPVTPTPTATPLPVALAAAALGVAAVMAGRRR